MDHLEEQPDPRIPKPKRQIDIIFDMFERLPSDKLCKELLDLIISHESTPPEQLDEHLNAFMDRAMSTLPSAQILQFPGQPKK